VLDWAKARGLRDGENPARWSGHLDHLLPARDKVVKHHAAIPYRELPAFMAGLRLRSEIAARALEFCILTAARTGEVIGSQWIEIDLEARLWTVPADRMKAGREHRVPLSARALEIIADLPRDGDCVFPGARAGKPLSNMAMLEIVRGMRGKGATVHGFRSTFRDWGAEQTSYPNEMLELALAHAVSDKVEAAYRRGDMMEKRRRLMDVWSNYCKAPAKRESNVTLIRERAS
jgi:integrase